MQMIKNTFKIDKLDVPEEIEGEFMYSIIGIAEIEFDYEE